MSAPNSDKSGLLVLHCPDEVLVDICFIQGVRGGNVSTWTWEKMCWPRDLLPIDIPNARIISYGYDADIIDFWAPVSENSVEKHAGNLVAALVGDRFKQTGVLPSNAMVYSNLEH